MGAQHHLFVVVLALALAPLHGIRIVSRTSNYKLEDVCPPGSSCPTVISSKFQFGLKEQMTRELPVTDFPENFVEDAVPEPERGLPVPSKTKMFVAVFSYPSQLQRRNAVRTAWRIPNKVTAKFVMCTVAPGDEDAVRAEQEKFGDILTVPCEEGYSHGKLTKKVLSVMDTFVEQYPDTPFFFKVDDDSFPQLEQVMDQLKSSPEFTYAGVLYKGGKVIRDKNSKFFEPYSAFEEEEYPPSASGGAGYILSRALVERITGLDRKTTEKHTLWNEDKAVAVWVGTANQNLQKEKGVEVKYLQIKGHDGYNIYDKCAFYTMLYGFSTVESYDLSLNHRLTFNEMQCLSQASGMIRSCFCAI